MRWFYIKIDLKNYITEPQYLYIKNNEQRYENKKTAHNRTVSASGLKALGLHNG
jgi:hypothetical protein